MDNLVEIYNKISFKYLPKVGRQYDNLKAPAGDEVPSGQVRHPSIEVYCPAAHGSTS